MAHIDWSWRFDFQDWLLLHPGAREVEGAPGWVFAFDPPEETGGPFWQIHVRHRDDGREFDFHIGMWMRGFGFKYPMHASFDCCIRIELHERYPEEYPDDPVGDRDFLNDVPATILLNNAFDAFFHDDFEKFNELITEAKKALGKGDPTEDAA